MTNTFKAPEKVILVHVSFSSTDTEHDFAEFKVLAQSAGADIIQSLICNRHAPSAKYFIGLGKANELTEMVKNNDVELVIFNHDLSPAQERNLEKLLQCRVINRTGLILDIFAQRARSFEGKLQVELAFLRHQSTRLVRGWTHLERQRGGIGLRGGPGETQLEIDRRLIRKRIKTIDEKLQKLRMQREQGRKFRHRQAVPTVALVGYTNAGKSTLFNQLTGEKVYVADQLFATLDPTFRRLELNGGRTVILADTVGFIRHLPHHLVNAFYATLEEVSNADLLLHVVDANEEHKTMQIEEVVKVLTSIKGNLVPKIMVYNKIDLCYMLQEEFEIVIRDEVGNLKRVNVSAKSGLGIETLKDVINEAIGHALIIEQIILKPEQGQIRAKLYAKQAIQKEVIDSDGNFHLQICLPKTDFDDLGSFKN